jgi:hypothetical protein
MIQHRFVRRRQQLQLYPERKLTSIPAWDYAATVGIVTPAHYVIHPEVYGTVRSIVKIT